MQFGNHWKKARREKGVRLLILLVLCCGSKLQSLAGALCFLTMQNWEFRDDQLWSSHSFLVTGFYCSTVAAIQPGRGLFAVFLHFCVSVNAAKVATVFISILGFGLVKLDVKTKSASGVVSTFTMLCLSTRLLLVYLGKL